MFGHLERDVARAEAAGVAHSLGAYAAIAASEQGDVDRADPLFATAHVPAIWRIRHLLRAGRAPETLPLIDAALAGADANAVWPYAATAWRETKDPRFEWLVRDGDLVSVIDLDWPSGQIEETADILRRLHETSGEFFDQSVRGGTQTGGPLFSRTEPQIRQLRKDMVDAVAQYTAALPEADPSHPLLGPRRDRAARFSGSWSVRLRGSGFHERHVHTRGWLSSALYLALPEGEAGGATKQGTLELGAPPTTLRLGQAPLRQVEPAVGRLVLFPSWLWHGTQPFNSGERLTIAFDVGPRP